MAYSDLTEAQQNVVLYAAVGVFNAVPGAYLDELAEIYQAVGFNAAAFGQVLMGTDPFKQLYPDTLTDEEFAVAFTSTVLIGLSEEAQQEGLEVFFSFIQAFGREGAVILAIDYLYGDTVNEDFMPAKEALENKVLVAEYAVEKGLSNADLETLQGVLAGVTNDPVSVDQAKLLVDELVPPTFTLEDALALGDDLPEEYFIDATTVFEPTVDIATAEAVFPAVVEILEGSLNQPALEDVFVWSIADTAENLLANQENPVLVGATSFSLTDPAGNITVPNAAAKEFLLGAANAGDYIIGILGNTIELTTATDIVGPEVEDVDFATTENNDIITAVASSLASTNQLNAGDQIDGGEGFDTLVVDMQGGFTGFTGDGFMKNVEAVNLTNTGTIARNFAAKQAEGVEVYNLTGAVNLSNLVEAGIEVNLNDRATGTTTIAFNDAAVAGTSDALLLGLNNIGTVKTDTVAEAAVTVTAAGIEELNIMTSGQNVVALGSNDAKDITIAGAGDLKLTSVGSGLKTLDASQLAGDLDVNLGAASGITTLVTGDGDDLIRATGGDLLINAQVDGGAGDNTLALSGVVGTLQLNVNNVQTIEFDGATALFSGTNASGIENVTVKNAANDIQLANMGAVDLNIELNKGAAGDLSSNNSGAANISVTGGTKTATTTNLVNTTLTQAAALELNVAQYSTLGDGTDGNITASKAQSLVANIDGGINNTIIINDATSAVITDTNSGAKAEINLVATKLVELNVTTAGDFDLATGSNLTAVENFTVQTSGKFDATTNDLVKVANISLSGSASASEVLLADIGQTANTYGTTLSAEGLSGNLETGNISSGSSVAVDVTEVLGDVTLGDIDATDAGSVTINADGTFGNILIDSINGKTVTVNAAGALGTVDVGGGITAETVNFTGSSLKANELSVTASKSATITGGLDADLITVNATDNAKSTATITVGLGVDEITLNGGGAGGEDTNLFVTITDFTAGVDILAGWSSAGIILNDNAAAATAAIDALNAFSEISGVTKANSQFVTFDAGATVEAGILFNNSVYTFNAGYDASDSILVKLDGISAIAVDWAA